MNPITHSLNVTIIKIHSLWQNNCLLLRAVECFELDVRCNSTPGTRGGKRNNPIKSSSVLIEDFSLKQKVFAFSMALENLFKCEKLDCGEK